MERAPRTAREHDKAPMSHALVGTLVGRYPELAVFTPDATVMEIKILHGLANLEQVRELGRRLSDARTARQRRAHADATSAHRTHRPAAQGG